jgi:hypothetical protein
MSDWAAYRKFGFPEFPVELGGVGALHPAFLNESRTSGCRIGQRTGNSGSRGCVPGLISRAKPFQIRSSEPPVFIPDGRTAVVH